MATPTVINDPLPPPPPPPLPIPRFLRFSFQQWPPTYLSKQYILFFITSDVHRHVGATSAILSQRPSLDMCKCVQVTSLAVDLHISRHQGLTSRDIPLVRLNRKHT